MIGKSVTKFCKTPELIYNYQRALESPKRCECHHRRELEFTKKELKARGEYWDYQLLLKWTGKLVADRLGTGYDATKTQVLKNVNGTLTWVDEA